MYRLKNLLHLCSGRALTQILFSHNLRFDMKLSNSQNKYDHLIISTWTRSCARERLSTFHFKPFNSPRQEATNDFNWWLLSPASDRLLEHLIWELKNYVIIRWYSYWYPNINARNVLNCKDMWKWPGKTIFRWFSEALPYCLAPALNAWVLKLDKILYVLPEVELEKLQRVQNAAARLVMRSKERDHISPILRLPVKKRLTFKLLLLTFSFKALRGHVPTHKFELFNPYRPICFNS